MKDFAFLLLIACLPAVIRAQAHADSICVLPEQALFAGPEFQPLRGNRDLMLATWFARMEQNSSGQAAPISPAATLSQTRAIAVSRNLLWFPEQGLLASRILRFGPAAEAGDPTSASQAWLPGAPGPLSVQTARNGPSRQTWAARVRIPYRTAPGCPDSLSAEGLLQDLCQAATDQRFWILEQSVGNDRWKRVDQLNADSGFKQVHSTEDWMFDPAAFCLYAKVIAIDWQDAQGTRYRIRVAD